MAIEDTAALGVSRQALGHCDEACVGMLFHQGQHQCKGERIYHAPWSRHYARTRVDTSRGDRWFCSEVEVRPPDGEPHILKDGELQFPLNAPTISKETRN